MSRSSKLFAVLVLVLAVVLIIFRALQIYTDFLWFGELGQTAVLKTIWSVRVKLGLIVGVLFFAWLYANIRLARKLLPREEIIGQRLLPDAERASIEKHIDKVLLAFAAVVAILAGITASGHWLEWVRFFNAVPFGKTDPLYAKEISFYVFRLPFIEYVWKSAFYAAVIGFIVATLVHLYNESIRVHGSTVKATTQAQAHCLTLLALCFVLKAGGYQLGVYSLLFTPGGAVPGGPGYSAEHYRLPVYTIQIIASLLCAGLTVATIWIRNLRLPLFLAVGLGLLAVLGGISFPYLMERTQVRPNALQREPKYIEYNIDATLDAYGLADVIDERHDIRPDLTAQDLAAASSTVKNIRIWDDRPLEDTYRQQQALRQYYEFSGVDVDRYRIDGEMRQVSIAARQIDYDRVGDLWPNRHLQYTHGHGICMSPVNMVDAGGMPHYWLRNVPPRAEREAKGNPDLRIDRPGLYFMADKIIDPYGYGQAPPPPSDAGPEGGPGPAPAPAAEPQPQPERRQTRRDVSPLQEREIRDDYVIVRSGVEEIDYPTGKEGQDTAKTVYDGPAGVPLSPGGAGSRALRRAAFFARFWDWPIVFYDLDPESRIIFNRWVPDRIKALAPFLITDPNPYPVIHDGRIFWIVDCYTITTRYPYSTGVGLGRTDRAPNYFRNAVKATVDAYDGTTVLYAWDDEDPLLRMYRKTFPTLFAEKSEMPDNLRQHVRYPRGLFELQSLIFATYHQKNPITFFQNEDAWSIPWETLADDERPVESYYVQMSLPGADEAEFLLMRPFTPINREKLNMIAWMAARCDGEQYGELRVYRFPKVELSYGPMQIEARISQDEWLADFFRLKSESNHIIRGHLLVIPIGDKLLYVEPIYLESKLNPVPKLSLVVAASTRSIGYGQTLAEAVAMLLSGEAAGPVEGGGETSRPSGPPSAGAASVDELARRLGDLYAEAERLRMQGDFAGYAEKVKALGPLIEELQKAAEGTE
ncbi:MAG: UPF0182 family protein [Armatimonadetes bacterium]|nr:UPF0182 family protein [Armatimonadota bacterium]